MDDTRPRFWKFPENVPNTLANSRSGDVEALQPFQHLNKLLNPSAANVVQHILVVVHGWDLYCSACKDCSGQPQLISFIRNDFLKVFPKFNTPMVIKNSPVQGGPGD